MDEEHFIILGGNGFIGFEMVMALIDKYNRNAEQFPLSKHAKLKQRRCCVILCNRGKSWDWDKWDMLNNSSTALSAVKHIRYNRKESPEECAELVTLMQSINEVAAVVDFSAYHRSELCRFVEFVTGKCRLYILISTDSVYEVCIEKQHSGQVLESDAVRPSLECDRRRYSSRDLYGHKKLSCEEYMHMQSLHPDGVPYTIFRLPDVIGPRDSTNRFWQYLLWLKLCSHHNIPFYLHKTECEKPISLCYVKDIAVFLADYVYKLVNNELYYTTNCCYNLGLSEVTGVEDLLKLMCDELPGKQLVKIVHTSSEKVPQILPSVSCGPVSTMKACSVLGWSPSSMLNAIKDTICFYEDIMKSRKFATEKVECMNDLLDDLTDIYPDFGHDSFRMSLESFLNL